MPNRITRCQYLGFAATEIGVTTLTSSGFSTPLAFRRPVDVNYRKPPANRNPINPFVLVAYASRAGSTMEIAHTIAQELENRNFIADISPIQQVTSLKGYSHVVIGSCIRMGAPLPEITRFITEHRFEFHSIPLAFFAVYLLNSGEDEGSQKARLAYLDPIRVLLPLQHEAFFSGVYDPTRVSCIESLLGNMVHTPVGDFRDWVAIKDWGQSIFSVTTTAFAESKAATF